MITIRGTFTSGILISIVENFYVVAIWFCINAKFQQKTT